MTSDIARELSRRDQISIRSDAEVRLALDMAVARLRSRGTVRFKGLRVTQEAVVNAAFLMLASMDDDALDATMGHFVGQLEDVLAGRKRVGEVSPMSSEPVGELTIESDRHASTRDIPAPKKERPKKKTDEERATSKAAAERGLARAKQKHEKDQAG